MKEYFHIDYAYLQNHLPFGDIDLIQIGRMFCKEGVPLKSHVHLNWFELTIITDGAGSISTNGVEVPVKAGDIHLSFPADEHKITSSADKPLKYDFFSFYTKHHDYIAELDKIMMHHQDARSRIFSDERIKSLVENGLAEFHNRENNHLFSKELLSHIFQQIVIYLIRDFNNIAQQSLDVNQAKILCYQIMHYLDTHIFTLKNLRDLEKVTHYNYAYLSTLFRKMTNSTLADYFQSSKLHTAQVLVKEGNLQIGEIASLLNYTAHAFSRAYKTKFGVPPSKDKPYSKG